MYLLPFKWKKNHNTTTFTGKFFFILKITPFICKTFKFSSQKRWPHWSVSYFNYLYNISYPSIIPDLVACWCDVHRRARHSASCCLGGFVSVQTWGWCPLRGHQRGLTLLTPIPISTGMTVAQSPQAGHILRYTVICGHVYGPMQTGSVWQLKNPERRKQESIRRMLQKCCLKANRWKSLSVSPAK